jgi:hypothetical protein
MRLKSAGFKIKKKGMLVRRFEQSGKLQISTPDLKLAILGSSNFKHRRKTYSRDETKHELVAHTHRIFIAL